MDKKKVAQELVIIAELLSEPKTARLDIPRELKVLRRNLVQVLASFDSLLDKSNIDEVEAIGVDRATLQRAWNMITSASLNLRRIGI